MTISIEADAVIQAPAKTETNTARLKQIKIVSSVTMSDVEDKQSEIDSLLGQIICCSEKIRDRAEKIKGI
jgi:hypothetical protein